MLEKQGVTRLLALYKQTIIGEIVKMKTILIGVAVFFTSSAAHAADLPRYDPNTYCESVSAVSGGSAMITNECIKMEQTAYNQLKKFGSLSPARQALIATAWLGQLAAVIPF